MGERFSVYIGPFKDKSKMENVKSCLSECVGRDAVSDTPSIVVAMFRGTYSDEWRNVLMTGFPGIFEGQNAKDALGENWEFGVGFIVHNDGWVEFPKCT